MSLGAIFNRFEPSSFKRMYQNAKNVATYSNKPLLYVLLDMSKCILKDNVGYMEYNLFHFVDKNKEERDTYITFNESQYLIKTLNDHDYIDTFKNKLKFNELFKDYIGREFIDAANCSLKEFKKYCKGKKEIFCKPVDSCSGHGIYKSIKLDKNTNIEELHQFMVDNKLFCEDSIVQHKTMNKLHEGSINTIRIVTVLKDNKAYFIYALVRMGINDMKVDNVGSGGIYTVLNDEGEIDSPAWSDKTISTYLKHPTTGFDLIGFKIPMFKKAVALCKKAALVEPHIRYVGWDVAITPDGPVLVEGNELPGYDMAQNYFASSSKIGLRPKFEEILGKIK